MVWYDDEDGPNYWVVAAHRNGPLMAQVARLWIAPDDVVLDATWGKGNFWGTYTHPGRLIAHDKYTLDGVDYRDLPEADGSIDVVVFDPPYVSVGGRTTSGVNEMLDRYGLREAGRNPEEVRTDIALGMAECTRVLRPGGRLMVKCADYVSSRRYQSGFLHSGIVALQLGLEPADVFVHASGTGPQPKFNKDGTPRRQEHSRRAHSYLLVFLKATDGRDG